MSGPLYFEDFRVGDSMAYGGLPVSAQDIVAFASVFDAQDFHVDAEKAKSSFLGTLVASGWHTGSLMMRMMADGFILNSVGMGAPGLDELKWVRPVRPGDVLSVRHTVLEAKESRSRRDIGLTRFRFEVLNQNHELVQEVVNWIIFARRGEAPAPVLRARAPHPPRYAPPAGVGEVIAPAAPSSPVRRLSETALAETVDLGSFTFTAPDIVAFAQAFDPQRFHVDEAAAKASLFGGLCASGWHTTAIWMRLMVEHRRRVQAAQGREAPRLGPSPGFRNLKWLKPVFAGDTISFTTAVSDKRASASRPGWGLAFHHNEGRNQHGDLVFAFEGSVFWEW